MFQLQKSTSSLWQEQMSVSNYFTKLKSLWDELINYRPLSHCACSALKTLLEFQQEEYDMRFLVALNENFAHVSCPILLMDPSPSVNKVFSLVPQEERQKEISVLTTVNVESAALMSKSNYNQNVNKFNKQYSIKKKHPTCCHRGILGHTVNKCYKLLGYDFQRQKGINIPGTFQL